MNISHRYFDLEEFFSSAAASGYTCCELWTGAMHLYVDCHGYDSLEQVKVLSRRYGVRIVGICPEQNNPKPWNIAARGEEARARTLAYFKNVVDIAAEVGAEQVMVSSGWAFLNEPIEDAWGRSASMLRSIAEYAGERGLRLVLEGIPSMIISMRSAMTLPTYTLSMLRQMARRIWPGATATAICVPTWIGWWRAAIVEWSRQRHTTGAISPIPRQPMLRSWQCTAARLAPRWSGTSSCCSADFGWALEMGRAFPMFPNEYAVSRGRRFSPQAL